PTTNLSFATKRFYRTRLNGFGRLTLCLPDGKGAEKNASGDIQPLAEYIHSLIVPKAVRRSLGGVNLCGLYAPVHFLGQFSCSISLSHFVFIFPARRRGAALALRSKLLMAHGIAHIFHVLDFLLSHYHFFFDHWLLLNANPFFAQRHTDFLLTGSHLRVRLCILHRSAFHNQFLAPHRHLNLLVLCDNLLPECDLAGL